MKNASDSLHLPTTNTTSNKQAPATTKLHLKFMCNEALGLLKGTFHSLSQMPCPTYNIWYKTHIIIKNYINIITDIILCKEQDDFREKDCAFLVSQLTDKHREYDILIYMAFIDFEKASDTFNQSSGKYHIRNVYCNI